MKLVWWGIKKFKDWVF